MTSVHDTFDFHVFSICFWNPNVIGNSSLEVLNLFLLLQSGFFIYASSNVIIFLKKKKKNELKCTIVDKMITVTHKK